MVIAGIIDDELLSRPITADSIWEYITARDCKRLDVTDRWSMETLVNILATCTFQTIGDIHSVILKGWDNFRKYENIERFNDRPFPWALAIIYTIIIADEKCRQKIATKEDLVKLNDYLLGK
jgi:hypothetical protein